MVNHYLQLDPRPPHPVFHTRLGLCVLDLACCPGRVGEPGVNAKIVSEVVASADAYVVRDVLSHSLCHLSAAGVGKHALAEIIHSSGLHRGTMSADLLEDLMASVRTSEAQLAQLLATWRCRTR